MQFDSNGFLIGWSLGVLFILFGPQSGNMCTILTLRSLLIPRLSRELALDRLFLPHDLLWGKNPGVWLTAIKSCQVHHLGSFDWHLVPVPLLPTFKMLFSSVFSVAALLITEVSAHGAVTSYVIDGTTYPG